MYYRELTRPRKMKYGVVVSMVDSNMVMLAKIITRYSQLEGLTTIRNNVGNSQITFYTDSELLYTNTIKIIKDY